jgi:hypothetical protein
MNGIATRFVKFGAGLLALVMLGWILTGYAKPGVEEMPYHEGVPTDWSTNHVIYTRPASGEQARELAKEPRYWQQLYRREVQKTLAAEPGNEISEQVAEAVHSASSGGLWAEDLGTNAAPGAGNYPAKFGFSLTQANCASAATPDYVVYSTGLQGSGTQASIVAYDNIYSGCTAPVPRTYWAYNTNGLILTSPVISLDGSQIAFVQTSNASLNASLVLLKWKASTTETVTAPGVPAAKSTTAYRGCTAPCMTTILLADGNGVPFDDRTSSMFYDFAGDIGWVGGTTGWLVELTGLFKGTPAEAITGGFPVHVNPSNPNALTGPVYDQASKNVFVGDGGGFFYRVASSNGAVTASGKIDFGTGLVEAPILDQTNGVVYAFSSSDGSTGVCPAAGTTACSAVYAFGTSFAAGTKGTSNTTVGQSVAAGNTPSPLYHGALDSAYYNSAGGTGNMYVCGNTGADPTLYRIPVAAGALGTSTAIAALTPAAQKPSCSPVTDFPNPNASASKAELTFLSVQNQGRPCANKGCLMNFVSLPWTAKTAYTKGQEILVLIGAVGHIETALSSGTSGTTQPAWSGTVGSVKTDGTVTWAHQGPVTVVPIPAWAATHAYAAHARINDGTNVEVVTTAGTSAATAPSWNTTIGGTTPDGTVTWLNLGPWPIVGHTLTGGTGGVIIDNTNTGAGGSQVYFFTLGNNACTTSGGTGGCAMQASQSSLN